jgi:hypothetical protein
MQAVKPGFARWVLKDLRRRRASAQQELFAAGAAHVWRRRFYDFNVRTERKRIEKLRYMHRNPVKRVLVQEPGSGCGAAIGGMFWRGREGQDQ